MDQGGQKCPYLDKALVCEVCVQPGAPCPVCAGVQSGQLHTPLRAPERGVTLVALEHPAQAHKDWSQNSLPLKDERVTDGLGGGTGKAVPVDAIENSPPGEGEHEGAGLGSVKDGNGKQGGFTCGITVSRQREITRLRVDAPSLVARMRRTPVTCVRKAQIVVKYRCWKEHMKNISLEVFEHETVRLDEKE